MQRGQDSQWLLRNILSKAQEVSDRPLFERLKSIRLSSHKAIKHGDAHKLQTVSACFAEGSRLPGACSQC